MFDLFLLIWVVCTIINAAECLNPELAHPLIQFVSRIIIDGVIIGCFCVVIHLITWGW